MIESNVARSIGILSKVCFLFSLIFYSTTVLLCSYPPTSIVWNYFMGKYLCFLFN